MNFTKLKSYLPYILSVVILLVVIHYLYGNIDQYRQLLNLSAGLLFLMFNLVLISTLIHGFLNYWLYHGLGAMVTLNEGIGLAAVSTLTNQLPFAGGMIAKGVYLKQRYRLAYTRFLSATLALYVCFVAANGVVGVAALAYLVIVEDAIVPTPLILGFTAMVASVLLLWIPIDASFVRGKWGQRLTQLIASWKSLSQNRRLVVEVVGLQLLMTLLFAGRLWIAFHTLSQDVSLAQCILFSSATIITRLVSIAPGGLGVREAMVASLASVLGFDAGVSVVAVVIDRLVATLVVITLGTVYAYILGRKVASAQPEPEPCKQ